jgi:hypothetical protein
MVFSKIILAAGILFSLPAPLLKSHAMRAGASLSGNMALLWQRADILKYGLDIEMVVP